MQAFRLGTLGDLSGFEVLYPFINRSNRLLIELIHADHVILWENIPRVNTGKRLLLFFGEPQLILGMYPLEMGIPMIDIILALPPGQNKRY